MTASSDEQTSMQSVVKVHKPRIVHSSSASLRFSKIALEEWIFVS